MVIGTQQKSVSSMAPIVLIILCIVNAVIGDGPIPTGRILAGEETNSGDLPFAGSLRVDKLHACGCSIIGPKKVITAAHCVHRDGKVLAPNRLSVRLGSTNQYAAGVLVEISEVTVHPEYYNLKNNLAVLTLETAQKWTNKIQAIEIATTSDDLPSVSDAVQVSGWGITLDGSTSYKLRHINLSATDKEECLNAYKDHDSSTICLAHALKEGACNGDGGSGAIYKHKLIGITSFIVGACGSRYPDVFVNVAYYADWITQQLV